MQHTMHVCVKSMHKNVKQANFKNLLKKVKTAST